MLGVCRRSLRLLPYTGRCWETVYKLRRRGWNAHSLLVRRRDRRRPDAPAGNNAIPHALDWNGVFLRSSVAASDGRSVGESCWSVAWSCCFLIGAADLRPVLRRNSRALRNASSDPGSADQALPVCFNTDEWISLLLAGVLCVLWRFQLNAEFVKSELI